MTWSQRVLSVILLGSEREEIGAAASLTHQDEEALVGQFLVLLDGGENREHQAAEDEQESGRTKCQWGHGDSRGPQPHSQPGPPTQDLPRSWQSHLGTRFAPRWWHGAFGEPGSCRGARCQLCGFLIKNRRGSRAVEGSGAAGRGPELLRTVPSISATVGTCRQHLGSDNPGKSPQEQL